MIVPQECPVAGKRNAVMQRVRGDRMLHTVVTGFQHVAVHADKDPQQARPLAVQRRGVNCRIESLRQLGDNKSPVKVRVVQPPQM